MEAVLTRMVLLFLAHGGNPNAKNARNETCIHSICSRKDAPALRASLLEILLRWRGGSNNEEGNSETYEGVSVNQVDKEGCSAIHKAASNGLTGE